MTATFQISLSVILIKYLDYMMLGLHWKPLVMTSPANAGGDGSTPSLGTKSLQTLKPKHQNIKQKQYCNKFKKTQKKNLYQKIFLKKNKIIKKMIHFVFNILCGVMN